MGTSENHVTDPSEIPVVYIHIFKAAGTSIQMQMRNAFGVEGVPKVNDGPGFGDRISSVLSSNKVKVLAGHFRYFRVAKEFEKIYHTAPVCFSFVRDPIDRIVSAYNYFRGNPSEKWHRESLHLDINDFVKFIMENDSDIIRNHQCKALSGGMEGSFEAAKSNIEKNFYFVGSVENNGKSAAAMKNLLGIDISPASFSNRSVKHQTRSDLSDESLAQLLSETAEDQKLYNYVLLRN